MKPPASLGAQPEELSLLKTRSVLIVFSLGHVCFGKQTRKKLDWKWLLLQQLSADKEYGNLRWQIDFHLVFSSCFNMRCLKRKQARARSCITNCVLWGRYPQLIPLWQAALRTCPVVGGNTGHRVTAWFIHHSHCTATLQISVAWGF